MCEGSEVLKPAQTLQKVASRAQQTMTIRRPKVAESGIKKGLLMPTAKTGSEDKRLTLLRGRAPGISWRSARGLDEATLDGDPEEVPEYPPELPPPAAKILP